MQVRRKCFVYYFFFFFFFVGSNFSNKGRGLELHSSNLCHDSFPECWIYDDFKHSLPVDWRKFVSSEISCFEINGCDG